jgi:hypothetical protein
MHLRSMYPPVPPLKDGNVHNIILRRPDQAAWPDFTLHIDTSTGRKQTYHEFMERVYDGATALGTPVSEGGLGLRAEDGEIVGILSENCMVNHDDYYLLQRSFLMLVILSTRILSQWSILFWPL